MRFQYILLLIFTFIVYPSSNIFAINTPPQTKVQSSNPDLLDILANKYINKDEVNLAIPLLNKAAEQNNANSLITLMTIYAHG